MNGRLPSLDLILDLVQSERDKQLAHFDALDNKIGIAVLGFSGLLIALAPDVPEPLRILGVAAASASAGLSLWAFLPRRFPVLQPSPLRRYLRAQAAFTRLTVLDTLEDLVNESSGLLRAKAVRLILALVSLSLAAGAFATGIAVRAL